MSNQKPLISVIIPARNEERQLPRCIASIRKALTQIMDSIEIIVVINRCTDCTEELAVAAGCRIVRNESKNLSQIRNAGAAQALGEIIVTIDADSRMSENMLKAITEELARPHIVGGGALILAERLSLGILLTGLCILPLLLRSGFSAGLFYCRKKDFDAIGGFNEKLASVEDIDFVCRLKAHGKVTGRKLKTLYRAHIKTSCRKFDQFGDWYCLRHPKFFLALMNGSNQKAADKYWYDCER